MNSLVKNLFIGILSLCFSVLCCAQKGTITGYVVSEGKPVEYANVGILNTTYGNSTDSTGRFEIKAIPFGNYTIQASCVGFSKVEKSITLSEGALQLEFDLTNYQSSMNEVVVTGTLKEVNRLESSVPVELFNPSYFKKNPTPNIFEALQNVNGVRPQLNCNICNTGDIHINGLEGPYTMILIDGMPLVSSLSTVYGLSGIPNSLIERVEIVKGPTSSLYGSEAVGGLINIITKRPENAPRLSVDLFATSWQEWNADIGFKTKVANASVLTGINYFKFDNVVDQNHDNFTDVTLQDRVSIFQKWSFHRKLNRVFSLAARYFYEDRWGGDIRWNKDYRGGNVIYGESIYTKRWELIGKYQLPVKENLLLSFSLNDHDQDSRYGNNSFMAQQRIAFSQLTWDKSIGKNDLLLGFALRYTYYDDNTVATSNADSLDPKNKPSTTWLPGFFIQDELSINSSHKLLMGFRYDYQSNHGNIFTPRIGYKWQINYKNILRLNAGTGFRVVNLFTEDHAALTGAREVVIKNTLRPEQSYNVNLNYIKKIFLKNGGFIGLDFTGFYTYFNNRIVGNYDIDPNKIIYDNLEGYAVSTGLTANVDIELKNGLKFILGGTFMDVSLVKNGIKAQQILTEKFTGTWAVSYTFEKLHLGIDYTGNLYSPMRLPLLGGLDPRSPYSPWWSIQNIQLIYKGIKNMEIYGGVKNLLNWTPNQGNPFIIARSSDPFDNKVQYDSNGQVLPSSDNPYALSFDTNYVYGPNQGIRFFLGVRLSLY